MSSSLNPSTAKIGDFRSWDRTLKSRMSSSMLTGRSVVSVCRVAMKHLHRARRVARIGPCRGTVSGRWTPYHGNAAVADDLSGTVAAYCQGGAGGNADAQGDIGQGHEAAQI